jgi:peptide/nickel transport system permease protein
MVGFGGAASGLAIGTVIGILAGYYRGKAESLINLMTDSLLAFPPLVFLLALVSVLNPSVETILIAFSVLTVGTIIRLARANTYRFAQREFVVAAKGLGATDRRIMFREILPNVAKPLLSFSMVIVAFLIIAEAGLSFLGLGIQPPNPSWGNMIAESQTVLQHDPHSMLIPATVLFLTVFAFNRLGEAAGARRESRQSVI